MNDSSREALRAIFSRLLAVYGPQHWWPADTREEIAIGAILTQNTAWTNVERAIAALRSVGALDLASLHGMDETRLAQCIRSAGTYRVKARRLKAFAAWVHQRYAGDLDAALAGETAAKQAELRSLHGIGPETADAILLYAADHPVFVVDAYAVRVLTRHGQLEGSASYATVQDRLQRALPRVAADYNEYHALLVAVGKAHCRRRAHCRDCPLEALPHDAEAC
jgi:endonuclease-3 related protein